MGCDISICVEGKINSYVSKEKKWVNLDTWRVNREERSIFYGDSNQEMNKNNSPFEFYVEEIMDNRDYELFSLLADVRSEENWYPPISKPKGLPKDIHFATKWLADDEGGHSHSYLSLKELKESRYSKIMWIKGWVSKEDARLIDKQEIIPWQIFMEHDEEYADKTRLMFREWRGYLNGNLLTIIKRLEEKMNGRNYKITNEEDIRIVFWFQG